MSDVKITIKLKNTELELSIDEAREFHGILDRLLFGVKVSSEAEKFPFADLKRMLEKEMPKIVSIPPSCPIPYPLYPLPPARPYLDITYLSDGFTNIPLTQ